jgi:hypothetical protein
LAGRSRRERREHHEANDGGLGETALPKSADCVTSVKNSRPAANPQSGMSFEADLEVCGTTEPRNISLLLATCHLLLATCYLALVTCHLSPARAAGPRWICGVQVL